MKIYDKGQLTEIRCGQTGTGLLIERDGRIIGKPDMISQIKEDIDNGHRFVIPDDFIVSAVFQKYGVKNANGRVYPENILKREVEKYKNDNILTHSAIGALDHPSSSELSGHDVAHNILDLRWEGRTLVGEMKLHLSPGYKRYGVVSTSGDKVANMILDGILVGVSSRGVGTVEQKFGSLMVADDFELVCWDVVMQPSTPGAYIKTDAAELRPFMEGGEPTYDNLLSEKIARIEKIIKS